jgi:hypothetical protein
VAGCQLLVAMHVPVGSIYGLPAGVRQARWPEPYLANGCQTVTLCRRAALGTGWWRSSCVVH